MAGEERRKNDNVFELKLNAIVTKIDHLADKNKEKFKTIIDYNKTQTSQINKLNLLMSGNGNPEKGHSTRIVVAEKQLQQIFKKFKSFGLLHYMIGTAVIIAIIKIAFFGG